MVSIAGWADWTGDLRGESASIRRVTEAMKLGEPANSGLWLARHVMLGHRRPAQADRSGPGTPMSIHTVPGTELVTVLSGCISNTAQLRRQLSARGHRLRTDTDQEVVLHAFLRWGAACVDHLEGHFAFALWDARTEVLLLARDRFGITPLFYAPVPGGLVFGSRLATVLAHPAVAAELDADGLAEMLAMFPARTPGHALLRGIHELPPAHLACIDSSGLQLRQYWCLHSSAHGDDEATTVENARGLIEESVDASIADQQQVAAILSGSPGAATMAALAARRVGGGRKVSTFAVEIVGAHDARSDAPDEHRDAEYAAAAADHLGSQHVMVALTTADLASAEATAAHTVDLPGQRLWAAPLHELIRRIGPTGTPTLCGDGSAALFGAMDWQQVPSDVTQPPTFPWCRRTSDPLELTSSYVHSDIRPHRYRRQRYAAALHDPALTEPGATHDRRVRQVTYLTLTYYLPVVLHRVAAAGAAGGVPIRMPFANHHLVQYLWNVPMATMNLGGRRHGLLRRAAADLLPATAVRPATGDGLVAAPGEEWQRHLRDELRAVLADPDAPIRPLLNTRTVLWRLGQHDRGEGECRMGMAFAYLLEIDAWLRRYQVTFV